MALSTIMDQSYAALKGNDQDQERKHRSARRVEVHGHRSQPEPGRIRVLYLGIFDPEVFHSTLSFPHPDSPRVSMQGLIIPVQGSFYARGRGLLAAPVTVRPNCLVS